MSDFETAKQFFLQGLEFLESNDLLAAEGMFARSLEIIPDRVSTLNNLSAIEIKLGKFTEAEAFARKAIALEENSPEAWSNLGLALTATDRHEEALTACDRALNCDSSQAMAWLAKLVTLRALKRYDDALFACEEALKIDPAKYEVLYNKSLILKELNREKEAQETYKQALDMRVAASPVYIGERCATQKGEALIVSRCPAINDSFKPFDSLSRVCQNFPGQFGDHLHEDFHFNYVFSSNAMRPSARAKIPKPDFIINNDVNGELLNSEGKVSILAEFLDSFGVPVVNHPTKAVKTIRDISASLIENIPGVLVPKTLRFSLFGKTRDGLAREIEDHFQYPLITRTLTGQEGVGMSKVDSRDALIDVLRAGCPENFFVTQFVDSRGKNQCYRKMRAAVIGDEILVIRADYDTNWNVHGRKNPKRWPFYFENPHLLEEEKRICLDPEAELGRPAIQSLRAIRERIPMDIFGIDFAVGADGLLVFYECNATMNLFSTAPKDLPNPKEAGDRLKLAFQCYFTSLVTKRG